MTSVSSPDPVRRRKVFYIPGYDPFHARRYRELYRSEAKKQAEISGYKIVVAGKPKAKASEFGWRAAARIDGAETQLDVEVLQWSDLVRDSMSGSIPATYWQLIQTAWIYISTGTLRRLMWLRKGPVIAAIYPVAVLLGQLFVAFAAGAIAAATVLWALNFVLGLVGFSTGVVTPVIRWAIILALGYVILRKFKAMDRKLFAYYLMHDYAFSARGRGTTPPALVTRMQEFEDKIAAALDSDVDEVLIVGHSSGAHLAISILANLIRAGRAEKFGPALGLLSLGQVVPMVSFLPKAHQLRADLAYLSQRDELAWIDVSAPGDGCSFALCDPVAVTGVSPVDKQWPLVISAAFTQTLTPETWQSLKRRYFRLHFQYLCAFDRPGDYDYFQITAGPLTLRERFKGRKPSMSRIDVPASKHTGLAA